MPDEPLTTERMTDDGHTVARAMVGASREAEPGVRVLESPEIRRLGGHSAIGDFFCL
jgi:hypothetical protein